MRRTVNFKKMISMVISMLVMVSMFAGMSAEAMTYRTLTYSAGDVDNLVGETEFNFSKIVDTTFDTALSNRFSRKGYTLKSWNVPSTGETVGTGVQYVMPNRDITFVANWEPMKYSVSFAGKGGKTADGKANITSSAVYGTEMVLPENEFTYNDYTFSGWKYDGNVYAAGETFEVPALISGSKIVFAAVWTAGSAVTTPVTTAATTTEVTTTTTTEITTEATTTTTTEITTEATATTTTEVTTEATTTTTEVTTEATTSTTEETTEVSEETTTTSVNACTFTKTFEINAKVDYTDNSKKMYNVSLSEILSEGTVEAISINLHSSIGTIGDLVMGIGANVNGTWTQEDYSETINSKYYTINFANEEVCSSLDGEFLQIGYWYGTTVPLYIDSITVTYKAAAETTTEITTEATTEETTTTTEVTTTVETETTTETTEEETTVAGDYNNDGVVTAEDVEALRKFIIGEQVEGFEITEETADVNNDGVVDVFDYMSLSRVLG